MTTNNSPNYHLTSSSSILNDSVIQITTPVSTKLDRDNFLTWKSQIQPIINGFGLSHHIDDSSQPPTKTLVIDDVSQAHPSFLSWQKQDQLLLKWLRSTISSPILSQYVGCKTAHHLWTSLHRVYSEVSSDRIVELPRSLQTETRGGQACTGSGRGYGSGSGQAEITTGGVNLLQMDKQNNNGSQGGSNSSHNIASQTQDKALLEAEAQRHIDIREKAEDKYMDMLLENALKAVSKLENQKRNI